MNQRSSSAIDQFHSNETHHLKMRRKQRLDEYHSVGKVFLVGKPRPLHSTGVSIHMSPKKSGNNCNQE